MTMSNFAERHGGGRVRRALALLAGLAVSLPAAPWVIRPAELPELAREGPAALAAPITTVVDGESPAGADPRDYVSYARYYWPDPARPDGRPFVRRDGHHNHAQVARGDRPRIDAFSGAVTRLAAAWHFARDEAAARRAGSWLRAWFVTPATRMNPNLDHAQVRPGWNHDRGNPAGVLDTRDFARVIDALRLLEDSPALTPAEHASVRAWFGLYLDWLLTAPNARAERAAANNHGTWYYAHVIPVARFVGREDVARELAREARDRLGTQFAPDGSQPEEIARADGLSYSRFNLEAWFAVARLGAGLGVDLWHHAAPNGASLRQAVEFLRPYNVAPATWPHRQHAELAPGFLDALLAEAATHAAMPDAAASAGSRAAPEPARPARVATPLTLPGAETFIYREVAPESMRLHVFRPEGWSAEDRRPAWIHFFGGGFLNGTPLQSAGYGRQAARLGLVGIAVDYRVRNRHGTDASQCVADARAALHWVQTHAARLGLDPRRVVVSGSSAGGHLALWTAIARTPWGSHPALAPVHPPAALILLSAASDTAGATGQRGDRFAGHGDELSPAQHLDPRMPPVLMFHGDADTVVPCRYAQDLHARLQATGNDSTLVTIAGGAHNLNQTPGARERIATEIRAFLVRRELLPADD